MKVLDLFSGIGGFSLGLERAGMETVAFCEYDKKAQLVLKKHWPDVPIYNDVRELNGKQIREEIGAVQLICGGFPCQDISVATKCVEGFKRGRGLDGERSGLWRECARLLREIQPRYAIFENVTNLLNGEGGDWFKRVLWDISKCGYDAEWQCISAAHCGLPHRRNRLFIIAYPHKKGLQGLWQSNPNTIPGGKKKGFAFNGINSYNGMGVSCIPENLRMDDGLPDRSHRVRQLGNAVVPQVVEHIGRAIMQIEESECDLSS
jgi:DNA (cytosine-5)-methyltransferase 1